MSHRVYLLSPAHCGGARARLLLDPRSSFELALRLRNGGATLGEIFSFVSGLYFRGKLLYAAAFADPPAACPGVLAITPGRGLLPAETRLGLRELRAIARVPVDRGQPRYLKPLERDLQSLALRLGPADEVVLLGSVATDKYVVPLFAVLAHRLRFPSEFAGRGDMSRGGLLLRAVAAGTPLDYVPLTGPRHGKRPPRLARPARPAAAPSVRT